MNDDTTIEATADSDWMEVKQAATDQARAGDMHAAQVYVQMELIDREARGLDLPPADDLASLEKAQAAVLAAIKPDGLTPRTAMIYSELLENRRRVINSRNYQPRTTTVEYVNRPRSVGRTP